MVNDVKVALQIFDTKIEKKRAKWSVIYVAVGVKTVLEIHRSNISLQWKQFASERWAIYRWDGVIDGHVTQLLRSCIPWYMTSVA